MSETKNRSYISLSDEHTNSHSGYEPADAGRLTNARQRKALRNTLMGVVAGAAVVGGVIHMAGGHEKQVRELAQANEQAANNPRTKLYNILNQEITSRQGVQYEKGTHNFYSNNGNEYTVNNPLIFRVKTSPGTSSSANSEYAAFYIGGGPINFNNSNASDWAYSAELVVTGVTQPTIPESEIGLAHVDQGGNLVANQNGHNVYVATGSLTQIS
jgi:hypothetical protein